MRRALAILIALAIPRAARAEGNPFACRTVRVDTSGLQSAGDLRTGEPALALATILEAHGLQRVSDDGADLTLRFTLAHNTPGLDPAGRLRSDEILNLHAYIRGHERPQDLAAPPVTLAGLGHFGAVGAAAGWGQHWRSILGDRFVAMLEQYLAEHAAGVRVRVDPKEARVGLSGSSARLTPGGELVIRCRPPEQEVSLHAELKGYGDQKKTWLTSTDDAPITLTLQRTAGAQPGSAPPAPSPTAPPIGPLDQPAPLFGRPSLAHLLAAVAIAAIAVAMIRRRRRPVVPAPAPRKLTVLFLAANPRGTPALDLAEEIRQIRAHIAEGAHRDQIEFIPYLAVRFDDVLTALNKHRPQVVHFSGHGQKDGTITLEGPDKEEAPLSPGLSRKLFEAFSTGEDRVRLVLLNACFSRAQADAIREVVDVTIGTTRAVSDAAAISFAAAFYRAVAFGRTAEDAYRQGLLGVEGNAGVAAPEDQIVLLEKDGIAAGGVRLAG